MCLMLTAILVTALPTADDDYKTLTSHPTIVKMHKEAQRQRNKYNKPAITLDEECCQIAQTWANYMASNKKFHHGKGDQIISRGYKSVKSVFRGWMNSSGHRVWVLSSKSTKCGWGCQKSEGGMLYWVGVFSK